MVSHPHTLEQAKGGTFLRGPPPLEIVLYVLHPKKVVFVLDAVVVKKLLQWIVKEKATKK